MERDGRSNHALQPGHSLSGAPLLLVASGPAGAQDNLLETARSTFKPIPETPPAVPGVEATADRVELGKMLYFEPRLSESHTISCNSCHIVGLGGVDMMETSLGHRWQHGGRNAPVLVPVAADGSVLAYRGVTSLF